MEKKARKSGDFVGKLCMNREVRKAMEDSQPNATSLPKTEPIVHYILSAHNRQTNRYER